MSDATRMRLARANAERTSFAQSSTRQDKTRAETDEKRREKTQTAVSAGVAGTSVQEQSVDAAVAVKQRAKMLDAIARSGIAKNNHRKAMNLLDQVPEPFQFLKRVLQQAIDQGLTPEGGMGRYVYGAIKSEAEQCRK